MGKIAKLHRNSVDSTLEDAIQADLAECVVIGRSKDGALIAYYSESATCDLLAVSALLLQHDAVQGLISSD